ncbi:MAG: outer membrane lipoprotein carrier protein LolA [Bacteroidales bacterium]|nr:outer membrane lipoprotein carrier protein LolA [Bacteroidales bacterium]
MRKYISLTICILALGFGLKAQNAEQVFKSAVDKLLAYDNVEIAFDYNMINTEADINESMEGHAYMQGKAYKFNIMGQDIICDGTTTWTYNADAEEVMISDADSENGDGTPLAMLNKFYDDITAKYIGDNKGDIRMIEAKTKSANKDFEKLTVSLNVKTLEFQDIHMFDNNGNEFILVINKLVTNQSLPDDFFTFKEENYPDAEIIDMR